MAPMAERRGGLRVPVQMWVEEQGPQGTYFQRSANLSAGGAFFVQTIPQPLGTRVRLKFTLPGEAHEISCHGEIVSAKADDLGMGVKFLDLDPEARGRIEELVSRLEATR